MTEIKFRAWDKVANRMLTWDEMSKLGLNQFFNHPFHYELSQFIGGYDKNGQEVYKGDKLQFTAEDEDNVWILIVGWSKEMLSWCLYDDEDDKEPLKPLSDQIGADFEIIGNIYERSETATKI